MEQIYLFILCGIPYSGKSTLSKKLVEHFDGVHLGRDSIWFLVQDLLALNNLTEQEDDSLWNNLWPIAMQGVTSNLRSDKTVIFDDITYTKQQRAELLKTCEEFPNVHPVILYLETSEELAKARQKKCREENSRHDIPSGWISQGIHELEAPDPKHEPVIVVNPDMNFEEIVEQIKKDKH